MLRFGIPLLPLHFVLQNQKRIDLARLDLQRMPDPETPSHKEFLDQCETLAGHQRPRTFLGMGLLSSPDNARLTAFRGGQKPASSLHLQTVSPARVAIPPGPVG